ncbi:MAG: hypothetical protein LBG06_06955 [Deltaproteobacteria bacterium]|jgi:hypothetical protein|nr:hypothetical protein [Deltaproteobacteria bacterium]
MKGKQDGFSKNLNLPAIVTVGFIGVCAAALFLLFKASYDKNTAIPALDGKISRLESRLDTLSGQDAKIRLILDRLQALPSSPGAAAVAPEPSVTSAPSTGNR